MQKRWSINSMMLTFATFSIVLVVWVLWAFKMGFGYAVPRIRRLGLLRELHRQAGPVPRPHGAAAPGEHPADRDRRRSRSRRSSTSSSCSRRSRRSWCWARCSDASTSRRGSRSCVLWITFVYTVNAFLIWGGGFFAQHGAVDFSGGYVIHLSAGVAGFVAAAVIGPRLQRDREIDAPNNLAMVAVGAGSAVARLERLQRRRPVRVEHVGRGGGAEHQPLHRGGVPGLGRLGLPHRPQAEHDRRRQRDDRRAGGDHPGRRLRQRLGRDRDRRHRLDARVLRAELPEPDAARSATSTTRSAWSTRTASPASPAACWSASSPTRTWRSSTRPRKHGLIAAGAWPASCTATGRC